MADDRLRDLKRQYRLTGAVADEAAYLLERVRVGDLSQERLELAAVCGYPAALHALPRLESRFWGTGRKEALRAGEEVAGRAGAVGKEALVHLALAAARTAVATVGLT